MSVVPRDRILVVDDEAGIRELVGAYLRNEGFEVDEPADGEDALDRFRRTPPDLVVLDLRLPGIDGLDVLREIRRTSSVYVIVLTARSDETDKLIGLELGADDYITKPFSPRELVARVRAVLRRRRDDDLESDEMMRFDGLVIDVDRREVAVDGQPVELTNLEFELLAAMAWLPWAGVHPAPVDRTNLGMGLLRRRTHRRRARPQSAQGARRRGRRASIHRHRAWRRLQARGSRAVSHAGHAASEHACSRPTSSSWWPDRRRC